MKIGLLLCDHVTDHLLHLNDDYDRQFTELLPGFDWVYYDLTQGEFPADPEECEAYICTGSKYSVYDDIPWIHQLKELVRRIHAAEKPFIGVCFGHQMMAEALGGRVAKAAVGWCVGIHDFRLVRQEAWMKPFHPEVSLLMSCRDQVVQLPPDSVLLGEATDCPVGIYRVGERMLGIQAHPEFSRSYARALMEIRRERIGEEKVRAGLASLATVPDRELLAGWMEAFFLRG